MRNRIFVSIAAYRDTELARTVRDLFAHAARPQALTAAIFDQSEDPIARPCCPRGARVILDRCLPSESHGACWARAQLQRRFDGEDFFLQIDAHHLFKPGWDALLLAEFAACPSAHPVLTSYLPPYELRRGKPRINAAASTPMHFSHFDQDGVVIYRSYSYEQEVPGPPVPARFFSGHFAFARRDFVERVPYDPELYFYGEESTMAARAFTSGFDLFHPGRTFAWHHYVRKGKPRHWDDHAPGKLPGRSWVEKQRGGVEKYRRIFCLLPHVSPTDGLGMQRSLAHYEAMAGVDHYWQVTHPATAGLLPPPSSISPDWTIEEGLLTRAEVRAGLPPLAKTDPRACSEVHVAILDASSHDAAARRFTPSEYAAVQKTGWKTRVRFRSMPLRLVVWPYIKRVGWGKKFERQLKPSELLTGHLSRKRPPKKPRLPAQAPRSLRSRKRPA